MPNRRITAKDYDKITAMLADRSGRTLEEVAAMTDFSFHTIKRLDYTLRKYAREQRTDATL